MHTCFIYSYLFTRFAFFRLELPLTELQTGGVTAVLSPLVLAGCTAVDSVIRTSDSYIIPTSVNVHIKSLECTLRREPLTGQLVIHSRNSLKLLLLLRCVCERTCGCPSVSFPFLLPAGILSKHALVMSVYAFKCIISQAKTRHS